MAPKAVLRPSEGGMGAVMCNVHRTHLSESFSYIYFLRPVCMFSLSLFLLTASALTSSVCPGDAAGTGVWLRPRGAVGLWSILIERLYI